MVGVGYAAQGSSEPFVASTPREMEKSSEVARWQTEETRILVQLETFLVGQEGAQGAKYQKEFSNNYSHLRGGRKLLFHSCPS